MLTKIKNDIAIASAMLCLLSGIVMCFLAFFLQVSEHIADNALWYFGETLLYAGSIFGIKEYVDLRIFQHRRSLCLGNDEDKH